MNLGAILVSLAMTIRLGILREVFNSHEICMYKNLYI